MACTNEASYRLAAANAYYGAKNKDCISPIADVSDSLSAKYFEASNATTSFYFWYNSGASSDPALAGKTGIEILINTNDSISDVVISSELAIEAEGSFYATPSLDGLSFILGNKVIGKVLAVASMGDSGFTVENTKFGFGGFLGRTSDAIEVSITTNTFEVLANQNGSIPLTELNTGSLVSCAMNLIEMTESRWSELIGKGIGDTLTPAGGTEFIGFGTSKNFLDMRDFAGELNIVPIDGSLPFTFWQTAVKPQSVNFSGTELQQLSVEFAAYIDETKDAKVSIGGLGDFNQDFRK